MNYLNLFLILVNFISFMAISFIYLYFTRQYYTYHVPLINSYHVVISTGELEVFIQKLKTLYQLSAYEISYEATSKYIRLFKNLQKHKRIVISKKIFESVGYELDYLASRIWMTQQQLHKNKLVWIYKASLKYVPVLLVFLMIVLFIFNLFVFVYMFGASEQVSTKPAWLQMLWQYPIVSFVFIFFDILLIFNYYFSARIKRKLETDYSQAMSKLMKQHFEQYQLDFTAARVYSQSIKLSYLPIYKQADFWETSKWVGAFVYI